MFKLDLHTHSTASPDGGLNQEHYASIFEDNLLDFVAVTDHNTISMAQKLHDMFGEKIIIGEEIMTREGEIIGLFLKEKVRPGLSAKDTIAAIKQQNGLVYIPHPLETVRKGISKEAMEAHVEQIDIVEVFNSRALLQNRGPRAAVWARLARKAQAASSDAHGIKGVGSTYTMIKSKPTRQNLVAQLQTAHLTTRRPPLYTLLYPKANRLRQKLERR